MYLRAQDNKVTGPSNVVKVRCPSCRRLGTFEHLLVQDIRTGNDLLCGQRRCPNSSCFGHLFFIINLRSGRLIATYPVERLDFDASHIADTVVSAFEEAITNHANQCYISASIMVRKTLEELCADQEAKGKNLKERIKALGEKAIIPAQLFKGLDNLRLLGNDAAHVDAKVYKDIGKEEVEIGIEFAKEVLKAVYQYAGLLEKMETLKDKPPTVDNSNN